MRVNEVTMTRIDGARLSTVISRTSRTSWPVTVPPSPRSTLRLWAIAGRPPPAGPAATSATGQRVTRPRPARWPPARMPASERRSISRLPSWPSSSRYSPASQRANTSLRRGSIGRTSITASRLAVPDGARDEAKAPRGPRQERDQPENEGQRREETQIVDDVQERAPLQTAGATIGGAGTPMNAALAQLTGEARLLLAQALGQHARFVEQRQEAMPQAPVSG